MKRLTIKDQQALLLAVGGLLTNAEDPKVVETGTAMCGKAELANVGSVWRRCWKLAHAKRPISGHR